MKKLLGSIIALTLGLSSFASAQDDKSATLEELLTKVREGRVSETQMHRDRERTFLSQKQNQDRLYQSEQATQKTLERESDRLERLKRSNDDRINASA